MTNITIAEYLKSSNFFDYNILDFTQGSIYKSREIDKDIIGIVIGSNACDIVQEKISTIIYFPLRNCSYYLKDEKRGKLFNNWRRIITQNHKELMFLPPDEPEDDEKKIIIDPIGVIIDLKNPIFLEKSLFLKKYVDSVYSLSLVMREKLSERISFLFNRTPLTDPTSEDSTNWVKEKIAPIYDKIQILKFIEEKSKINPIVKYRKVLNTFKTSIHQKNLDILLKQLISENKISKNENNEIQMK